VLSRADVDQLERRGRAVGLAVVDFVGSAPFVGTRADLEARRAAGLHAGMHVTYGSAGEDDMLARHASWAAGRLGLGGS